jgi:hypothetical protein
MASYYELGDLKDKFNERGEGYLRGDLYIWNPQFDARNMRTLLPGKPPGDLGEIALAWGIVGDRVCLIHVDESRSEISRAELAQTATWFSGYLDECLVQLLTHQEVEESHDARVICGYLGLE